MKKIIGACMVALPFLAIIAATIYVSGWVTALAIWATAIAITALLITGTKLMVDA